MTDNIGDESIEINIESLIAELEAEVELEAKSIKKKTTGQHCRHHLLDEYMDRKRIAKEVEDFDDFKVDN